MKGSHGTHKASKLASGDVISSMPDNVIANIMNHLPIQDAVRTSILARNWRLKWTLLTHLIFDYGMPVSLVTLAGPDGKKYYDSRIISRLLFALKGPVTKFVLHVYSGQLLDVADLYYWVLFLSGKGIKEFTVFNYHSIPLRLPIHLFSCLELTHLKLRNCLLNPPPTFCVFPNLLSLVLRYVHFESCKFGEFITQCPLLEIMQILLAYDPLSKSNLDQINLDDISKLQNLKKLLLPLFVVKSRVITTSSIFQSLGFLPKLAELYLDFEWCEFVAEGVACKWVPTAFPCLNALALDNIDFRRDPILSCVFRLIWGSPNLQQLRLIVSQSSRTQGNDVYVPPTALFSSGLDNNMMAQLQLQNIAIERFTGSKNEVCLVKYLLACSPFLKRIGIYSLPSLDSDEKLQTTTELLMLQRASPAAQVEFSECDW